MSTASRGYGKAHRYLRERLRMVVNGGSAVCARCGERIAPEGQPCCRCRRPTLVGGRARKGFCGWDVGHDDSDRSRYNGAVPTEHACCNRSAGQRKSLIGRVMRSGSQVKRADWY